MKKAQKVLLGMVLVVGIGGTTAYVLGLGHESTDDATIEGHIVTISSRVPGQVQKLLVTDNQFVHAGDPLVELDTNELDARLSAARADLSAAHAAMTASQSDVAASTSRLQLADLDLARIRKLAKDGVVSQSEVDAKKTQYDQAKAAYDQAIARFGGDGKPELTKGDAKPETKPGALGAALARVQQAEASYKLAEVNLSYTTIKAPIDGVVSRRSVETGQVVAPGTPLLALVDLKDVWVSANFKEDQLREMKVGQKAEVQVDTYGSHKYEAEVASVGAATGSKFALIPPDNASGNFVKVVQRIPVLVHFKNLDNVAADHVLRPGMSAFVKVVTK